MMAEASSTPTMMARKDFFRGMCRRPATREPVHAPVPGSGMPTKSTRPQKSYF